MTDEQHPEPRLEPDAPDGSESVEPAPPESEVPAPPTDGGAGEQPDWAALVEADPRSPAELLAELTEAEARRDEYLEDVRRARAEFDNYRKRVMREGTAQRTHGRADVIGGLLEVLDDFDRTLQVADSSEDVGLASGIGLVHGKLTGVLRTFGVVRIDETEVAFDPTRHEAVQQVPAEEPVEEPMVSEVFRPGYEVDGRVLRPAMVVVRQ